MYIPRNSWRSCIILFALSLGIMQAHALPAGCNINTPGDTVPAQAKDRGLLWKLTRDGKSSHIYATVHLARKGWNEPGPALARLLQQASRLVVELDSTNTETMNEWRAEFRKLPPMVFPFQTQHRINTALAKSCASEESYENLGWPNKLLNLQINIALDKGISSAHAIEPALIKTATSQGQAIIQLETPKAQVAAFEGSRNTPLKLIEEIENGNIRRNTLRILEGWNSGDSQDLSAFYEWCDCVKDEEDRQMFLRMYDHREEAMADRIDRLFSEQDKTFVAIGVLHLLGPGSLLTRLREKGYEVERVRFERQATDP